jgi:hypothetical protein
MTSHHPEDVNQRYCGNCHKYHEVAEFFKKAHETAKKLDETEEK